MIEIIANRKIELYSIVAISKVWVEDDRPDILWLLQNFSNSNIFSQGESNTLHQYLKNYLKMVDDEGNLNDFANELIRKEQTNILIPESGIYEFILFDDIFTNKTYPVHFIRHTRFSRKDLTEEGRDLTNYKSFENISFTSWNQDQTKFKIQFITSHRVQFPVVLDRKTITGQIKIVISDKEKSLGIKVYDQNLTNKQLNIKILELNEVCKYIIPDWDERFQSQRISFDEAKKFDLHYDFRRNYKENAPLPFKSIDDENLYSINIKNIQLIPSNNEEAIKWSLFLLEHQLKTTETYISSKKLNEVLDKIINDTPIGIAFPNLSRLLSINQLIDDYREENPSLYWRVKVADDLLMEA